MRGAGGQEPHQSPWLTTVLPTSALQRDPHRGKLAPASCRGDLLCSLPTGFLLIGNDVKLNSPSSIIGQALTEILQHPERARDALRVLLHLVRGRWYPAPGLHAHGRGQWGAGSLP